MVAMHTAELLVSFLLFSSVSYAWPSGWDDAADVLKGKLEPLMMRQASSSQFDLSFTGVQGNTATTQPTSSTTDDNTSSTDTDSAQSTDGTQTGSNTASATGSQQTTGTATQTGKSSGKSKGTATQTSMITYDPRLPAGGVSMLTPNPFTTSYYKIENYVTFAWNYTSLSATPSAVDVLASCSSNSQLYTIALNQTFQPTQKVVWDTKAYQANASVPLLMASYTLIIHDAAKDVSATPMAGYLGTYDQFTFGMYLRQPYDNYNVWVCATCNSALTQAERHGMWTVLGMAGITILSFGWFTGVAGLW